MRFTRWDQELTSEATTLAVSELALRHSALVDHQDGNYVTECIRRRDYRALCSFGPRYAELSPESAYHLRQALAFFQKRSDIDLDVDPQQVAHRKFEESEGLCFQTNELFRLYASGKLCFSPDVESVFHTAQRKIAQILGPVPTLESISPKFGPGATTQIKKRDASPRAKLGQTFACSEELAPIAQCCLGELQGWIPFTESDTALVTVEIHPGILNFVRKNAKTDRAIVVEPMLNSMFQLGIGNYIAHRLRRWGVDIRDQSRNQELAREGSLSGALATLDLSSASDTIALELVYNLLPIDWAHFLSRFRTGTISEPDGSIRKLHKFSSMGNGFTFPLETLIFYALAKASCVGDPLDDKVSVYGDDIIVPVSRYPLLTKVLLAAGFIPNVDKSFCDGPFRESCGKDYFSGFDIRPFYLKGPLSGRSTFVLHNFYVRHGWLEFANHVLTWIDKSLRLFGPDGYGDGHLLGVHRVIQKRKHLEQGWEGYTFDTFTDISRKSFRVYPGDHVWPSYSIYAAPPPGELWNRVSDYLGIQRRIRLSLASRSGGKSVVYENGAMGTIVPGATRYKRISIYVLGC